MNNDLVDDVAKVGELDQQEQSSGDERVVGEGDEDHMVEADPEDGEGF